MQNVHVTVVSPNYYPEDTAIGLYNTQMVDFLAKKSLILSVVTAFPYYPAWEIYDDYITKPIFYREKKFLNNATHNSINIYRYRHYVPKRPTFLKRVVHLCDFTFGSFFNLFKIKKTDVIFTIIPFTSSSFLALLWSKITGAILWIHIQDFEFDAIKEAGIIEKKLKVLNKFLFLILFKLEKFLLSKADVISSISMAMCQKITDKTGRQDVFHFPNWIDADDINPDKSRLHHFIKNHSDKFTLLYAGNIGEKQDWDIFRQIVKQFNTQTHIHFIVVGEGATKELLLNDCKNIDNISFYPPVPFNELNDLLCSADMHILCQKANIIDTVMPSKILGMFASAKPSLIVGNDKSEIATLMKQTNLGYFVTNNNISEIISVIQQCANNKEKSYELGKNARKYVTSHFSKDNILQKFYEKILLITQK